MINKKLVRNLVGGVTILAPILTLIADAFTREREMDEIADRVVARMKEGKSNGEKMDGTEEKK